MKLNILLVAAAVAKREIKFDKTKQAAKQAAKAEKKGLKNGDSNQVRSVPEPCAVTFAKGANFATTDFLEGDFKSQPILDVDSNGTSGHIDMDNYPNSANCYVDVVADCDRITAKIVHAGLEPYCSDCNCDSFWFNDESSRVCGCGGTDNGANAPHNGDGCHDMMAYYEDSYGAFDGMEINDYGTYSYYEYGNWQDRVFNQGSFRLNFKSDSYLWGGNVRIEWSCTEEPGPIATPTDAIGRLQQLLDLSIHFLDSNFPSSQFYNKWKSISWKVKFSQNVKRMEYAFGLCGETDLDVVPEPEWESYDQSNFANAIDTLTTGFIKWTDIYLENCNGQRNHQHQLKRMNRWNLRLKELFDL